MGIAHISCSATRSRLHFLRDPTRRRLDQPRPERLSTPALLFSSAYILEELLNLVLHLSTRSIFHNCSHNVRIYTISINIALLDRTIHYRPCNRQLRPQVIIMSLKRKASFPSLESQNAPFGSIGGFGKGEEPPQHLNSRTRKRFRNDRPEENVVYGKAC